MTETKKKILLAGIDKLFLAAQEVLRELLTEYNKMISTLGRVKSFHNDGERILKLQISSGYDRVNLNKNGNNKNFKVHILVAKAFIPNPKNKPVIIMRIQNMLGTTVQLFHNVA